MLPLCPPPPPRSVSPSATCHSEPVSLGKSLCEWHLVISEAQCPRFKNYCPQPLLSPESSRQSTERPNWGRILDPAFSAVLAAAPPPHHHHHRVHVVLPHTNKATAPHQALLLRVAAVCPAGLCAVVGHAFIPAPSGLWTPSAGASREGRAQAAGGCLLLPCDTAAFSVPPAHTATCTTPRQPTTFRATRALRFPAG